MKRLSNKGMKDAAKVRGAVKKKLRSQAGESISEVLVAVLIVGLATVLFATMVNVATMLSSKGTELTERTYAQLSAVDKGTAGPSTTEEVTITGGTVDTKFSVDVITSTPEEGESGFTFTRYELAVAQGEG